VISLKEIIAESVKKAKEAPLVLSELYDDLQKEADDEKQNQEKIKTNKDQSKAKSDADSLFSDDDSELSDDNPEDNIGGDDVSSMEKPQKDTSNAAKEKAMSTEDVSTDTEGLIELVNLIRSGQSTKDPNTMKQLRKWFEEMNEASQLFTITILDGLKDIITGGQSANLADKPSDPDIKDKVKVVSMDDENKDEHGQPRDFKDPIPDKTIQRQPTRQIVPQRRAVNKDNLEDITPPVVVGRRNESYIKEYKNKIIKILSEENE